MSIIELYFDYYYIFLDSRKNIVNYPDRQSPLVKDDRKKDDLDRPARSLDRDTLITESVGSVESPSEVTSVLYQSRKKSKRMYDLNI